MDFADNLIEAVRQKKTPVLVGIDPRPEELPPGFLDKFPGDPARHRRSPPDVRLRGHRRRRPAGRGREVPVGLLRGLRARGARGPACDGRICQAAGPLRHLRRQAERYRLHRRGVRPGLPRQGARRRRVRPLLARRRDDRQPLPGHRRRHAVRQDRRAGAQGGLRPRPHEQCLGTGVPGPRVRTASPSTVTSPGRCWTGPPGTRGPRDTTSSGRSSGRPIPRSSRSSARPCPGSSCSCRATEHREGTSRDIAAAFDENGLGAIVNNSRGITYAYARPPHKGRFGNDWQGAVRQAVHDMIDDLAANTPAGKLRV